MFKYLFILCIAVIGMMPLHAQDTRTQHITVKITNLKSNDGKVAVALYNKEAHFLRKAYRSKTATIDQNTVTVVFKEVPQGTYAVSMYHDENNNGELDTNFMKIPKEDYGCSNNARGFMGPPKWRKAKFELNSEPITQHIKL